MGLSNNLGKLSNMITSTGSAVGIAQASPAYTLDVSGTGRFTGALTALSYSTLQNGLDTIQSGFQLSTASGTVYSSNFQLNASGGLSTWTYNATSGWVNRMTITTSGNVGIGVSSPTVLTGTNLIVKAPSSGGNGFIQALSNDSASSIALYSGLNSTDDPSLIFQRSLRFGTATDVGLGSYTERMRITSGGNVGINNTTPSTYLDVSNNGTNNNAYITTRNTGINGYRSGAIFTNSAAGGLSWYLVSTNNGDGDWGGGKFAISTNNAVGVYLNGSTATTWTGQSDIRLKDIDSEIENAIDKVNKLRGVRFTWKSDETKKMQVGLIAQEVKEVLPEAVDFDETNEDYRMGVQYTDLIPLLVNAIKELSAQNQDLKSRLDKAGL